MNRHLQLIYSDVSTRLLWPVLAFLALSTPMRAQTGPGCVSPAVWLRGDAGVTLSGTAVTAWASQTGTVTMLPGAVAGFPSLPIGVKAASTNFNPGLTFNNVNWASATGRTYMDYAPTGIINKATGTMYVVANPTLANANAHLAGWYIDGDYPSLNMTANRPFYFTEGSSFAYGAPANSLKDNTPFMLGTSWTNGGGGTMTPDVRYNGNSNQSTLMFNVNTSLLVDTPFRLGADTDWGGLTGEMLEVLVFPTALSTTEKQKVETYLAVKYGLTKSGDYVSGTGSPTTIWGTTTNAGYNNSIFGIGRSDCQNLNQKQSRSTNGKTLVTMGNGTGIAATNPLNSNNFSADNSFEMVGDNGLPASFSTTYNPTQFSPVVAGTFFRMARTWRVQETGTVGTVTVSILARTKVQRLLVSADGTFTPGSTQEILMTSDGNGNMTATVDFNNGDHFSFGAEVISPGCVAGGPALWLKGDAGVAQSGTAVTSWTDQGYSGAILSQTVSANQPGYTGTSLTNFNPGVTFNNAGGAQQWLRWAPTGDPLIDRSNGTLYSIGKLTASSAALLSGWDDDGNDPAMGITASNIPFFYTQNSAIPSTGAAITNNVPFIFGALWQNNMTNLNASDLVTYERRLDGVAGTSPALYNAYVSSFTVGVGGRGTAMEEVFRVGRDTDYGGITGDMLETVVFESPLTAAEKQRLESYFGIRYGMTLPFNYLSGSGATIYNVSSYSANVTGIGRDDCQGLNQKQSKSVNTNALVTIGNGTGIAATNTANANTFAADQSFDVFGDNGAPANYSTTYAPTSFVPSVPSGFYRMGRTWRVQETGTVGNVTISVPATTMAQRLLVSADGTFTPGNTQEILMTSDGNGNLTAQVDFANGDHFSFGAVVLAPGCVVSGLDFWYDPATSVTMSGTAVTSWADRSIVGKGVSVTQTTTNLRPTFSAGDVESNFNPYVNFFNNTRLHQQVDGQSYSIPHTTFGVVNNYVYKGDWTHFLRFSDAANAEAGTHNWGIGHPPAANDKFITMHYIDGPFSGGSGSAGVNGVDKINSNRNIIIGKSLLYSGLLDTQPAATTASVVVSYNGNEANWTGNVNPTLLDRDDFFTIGGGNSYGMNNNKTSEIVSYARALTLNERQRVNTYFGIKHGLTLEHNYLAGNSAVVYNVSSYSANVTGIGRDDCQGLNQKQSKSVNDAGLVTIGNGTSIAATNVANANAFAADQSFEVFGDNGLAASHTTVYTPASFTAPTTVYSMARIWRVQETGTVGTVTVSIPGSGSSTYLLVRSNATFTTGVGTQEIQMLPDGNGNLTAQVNFADGQFFTFAKPLYAPGCVAADLLLWYKPEVGLTLSGSTVTGWMDQVSGIQITPTAPATGPTTSTASVLFNYNPALNFNGTTNILDYRGTRFISATSGGTLFGAALANTNAGYENLADLGIDNPHMGLLGDDQIMWLNGSGGPFPAYGGKVKSGQMQVWDYFWNTGGPGQGQRLDGTTVSYPTSASSNDIGNYAGAGTFSWGIGGYNDRFVNYEPWTGNIAEVALYSRNLSEPEKDRVDTYMAVKYGVTLRHNYVSGNGTTIYDVSSFSANVTGVGRDDCQDLYQKQSKSVNAGSRMTMSLSNTIAASNAANSGTIATTGAFITFGDNSGTGTTPISQTGACPPPPIVDRLTNLAYKVTETGSVSAVFIREDVSGFGFNAGYPVYMQVYSDASYTNQISSVPMSVTNGFATTQYDFPANATSYIRFAGNTTAPANMCEAPKSQTFHWNRWWYGTKQQVLLPNYIPVSSSASAAMTMSVSVTDGGNNNLLYKPTVDWWPVFDGYGLFIPRYDNNSASGTLSENNIITTRMQFRQGTSTSVVAAQTVDFLIYDLDGFVGGRDIVRIYGKQGSNTINPQLSQYKPTPFDPLQLNYQGNAQQAIGSNIPWDLGAWGYVYVNFNQPVEEVFVEYRKDNLYAFNVYNDMRIGPVTVTCRPPTPKAPNLDNIYIFKEVSPNPVKTGDAATYKFTIQNTNCATRNVNLNDVLPGGLIWKDSTFVTSTSLTVGSVNNYGNTNTLTINNLTVPPGTHYMYATVTGNTVGVYPNQASYTATNGTGAAYLSDDPSQAGTSAQPTPLTVIANDPNANLAVTKTVDKATAPQNGTITYTYRIANPNGSAVSTSFQDVLPGELTYVGGSLSGLSGGGYASSTAVTAYSGSAVLTMRDLSVPANSTLTFSIVANTNSYTAGAVANNVAQVTPEMNSGFRMQQFNSTVASTTIVTAPTVSITNPLNTTSALNPTVSGTATPGSTVVLTSSSGGTLCTTTATAGGTWACPVNLTSGAQTLSAVATNSVGSSSPAISQITAAATSLQVNNPPALIAPGGSTNTGNAATELTPSGGTTPYSYSNDTGNASCTAVPGANPLPPSDLTVNSGTGSYSYTAPATAGVYYFCIKVCDATPTCITKTYTLTVTQQPGTGTLDCSTAQIMGISAGTPGNGVLKLTINVTLAGPMAVSVTGSGLSTSPNPYMINPTATGTQTFFVPLNYSGASFAANTVISVSGAGSCTVNMTAVTPRTVSTSVLNLGPACTPASAATLVK